MIRILSATEHENRLSLVLTYHGEAVGLSFTRDEANTLAHDLDSVVKVLIDFTLPTSACKTCGVIGKHQDANCAACERVELWSEAEDARLAMQTEVKL